MIIAKCLILRNCVLVVKNIRFLNFNIKDDYKIITYYYNEKKINIHNSIMLLIENIYKLSKI